MTDQRNIMLAYRRLFLKEDGTYTPDGEVILRDLEAKCGWMVTSLPVDNGGRVDPLATAAALERRGLYAHIKQRLHGALPKEQQ